MTMMRWFSMEIIFYYANFVSQTTHSLCSYFRQSQENSSHCDWRTTTFNLSLFVYFTICFPNSLFRENSRWIWFLIRKWNKHREKEREWILLLIKMCLRPQIFFISDERFITFWADCVDNVNNPNVRFIPNGFIIFVGFSTGRKQQQQNRKKNEREYSISLL